MPDYKGPLDYIDVATRIVEFRNQYPTGSLQQVKYEVIDVNGKAFLAFTAAAYRTPDDERPGIGTAWEPIPGPTNFTRDSEMQNAETAAWGRAIVAALAADTKKGIASQEEVRNRSKTPLQRATEDLAAAVREAGMNTKDFADWAISAKGPGLNIRECTDVKKLDELTRRVEHEGSAILGAPDHDAAQATLTDALGAEEQQ